MDSGVGRGGLRGAEDISGYALDYGSLNIRFNVR